MLFAYFSGSELPDERLEVDLSGYMRLKGGEIHGPGLL
jgi:hypothetical protein